MVVGVAVENVLFCSLLVAERAHAALRRARFASAKGSVSATIRSTRSSGSALHVAMRGAGADSIPRRSFGTKGC